MEKTTLVVRVFFLADVEFVPPDAGTRRAHSQSKPPRGKAQNIMEKMALAQASQLMMRRHLHSHTDGRPAGTMRAHHLEADLCVAEVTYYFNTNTYDACFWPCLSRPFFSGLLQVRPTGAYSFSHQRISEAGCRLEFAASVANILRA